jgi:hypothetical protein
MGKSRLPAELIAGYRAADYRVITDAGAFCFRVDEYSPRLAGLLAEARRDCALFVTAHNPFSEQRADQLNQAANERLRRRLAAFSEHVFDAAGVDRTGAWPSEPGFLALGVPLATSREVGEEFLQNAVVCVGEDAVPRLVLLR